MATDLSIADTNWLHDIIAGLNAIIWESDIQKEHFVYISQGAERVLGYPLGRWLREPGFWDKVVHPDDRSQTQICRLEGKRGKAHDVEYRAVRADGQIIWIRDIVYVITDETGKPNGMRGVMVDITSTKQTELALSEAEGSLRLVVENARDHAIFRTDPDGTIMSWNIGAERITGYSEAEALGKPVFILSTAEDRERKVLEHELAVAKERGDASDIRWHTRKDGSRFWAFGITSALRDERGHLIGFAKLMTDMTKQKMTEESLRRAKEAAEAASEAKSQFVANMSHEIRTPLSAIIGFADLLGDRDLTDEDRLLYLESIKRNGEHLAGLIDDILDLSKVEAGRLEVERHEFILADVVNGVVDLLREKARAKGIRLEIKRGKNLPKTIFSDPTRLRQILINIVGNAIKFTARGSVTLQVALSAIPDENRSGILSFTVTDTGLGIPSAQHSRLFQEFMQADSSTSRDFGGTGLGLALSRRLARALGGDVCLIHTEPGQGSTFEVTVETGPLRLLPLHSSDMKQMATGDVTSPPADKEPGRLRAIKILLVDDAPDNRVLLGRILGRSGALVDFAVDGLDAVEKVEAQPYDAVLMDMQMPKLNGYDATRCLRRQGYEMPIIALTANAMQEERERCLAAGCDDYLTKPINRDLLFDVICRRTGWDGIDRP